MGIERVRNKADEAGFTLVELIVAMTITAVVFLALAMTLAGDLKAVAVQKTRTAANEIATQGIEDLQRYDFNDLGVCTNAQNDPAPDPALMPASLATLTSVQLPNCGTPTYSDPCHPLAGTVSTFTVPHQTYTCLHNNVSYSVRRYIMWSDNTLTGKRLAVFVDWIDAVGHHEISQQSSLRSPNSGAVVGAPPPQFVSVSVNASDNPVELDGSGNLTSSITFSANVNGLKAADTAYVTLNTLTVQPDGTVTALPRQFAMTSPDGINWSTTVSSATAPVPAFGAGSQYVVFTAVRNSSDGLANSKIAQSTLTFCPNGGCPSNLPALSAASATTPISIDSSGVLQTPFTINVTANNLDVSSTVNAVVQTQTGAVAFPLSYSNACSNGGNNCTSWTTTIQPGVGNTRFLPGSQPFYITAIDPVPAGGTTIGSSAVAQTNLVTFG